MASSLPLAKRLFRVYTFRAGRDPWMRWEIGNAMELGSVVELSSSDENDDFLLPMKRAASAADDDDDDVIIIEKSQCTAANRRSSSRRPPTIEALVEDDFECCIVASTSKTSVFQAVDVEGDELVVTGETGPVACRDFPHARHLCVRFPFNATPHINVCEQCHCFVCDTLAPCDYWSTHCDASDKEAQWLAMRKSNKTPELALLPPVATKIQRPRTPQSTYARRLTVPLPRPAAVVQPVTPPPSPLVPIQVPVFSSNFAMPPAGGAATMADYALGLAKRVPKVRYYTTSGLPSSVARNPGGVAGIRPPAPTVTSRNGPSRHPGNATGCSVRQFRTAGAVLEQQSVAQRLSPTSVGVVRANLARPAKRAAAASSLSTAGAPTAAPTAGPTAVPPPMMTSDSSGAVRPGASSGARLVKRMRPTAPLSSPSPATLQKARTLQTRKRSSKVSVPGGQVLGTRVSQAPDAQPVVSSCPSAHHFGGSGSQCKGGDLESSDDVGTGGVSSGDEYLLALEALFELNQP